MVTIDELIARGEIIRDETDEGANTALRIGSWDVDMAQYIKENKPTKESLSKIIGLASQTDNGLMSKDQVTQFKAIKDELDKLKDKLNLDTLNAFTVVSNLEYAFAIVDQDESVFFAIRWDASLYCPYFDFETLKTLLQYDADNEGRLARTVDAVGHVIEATEQDGTKYIAKLRADSVDIDRLKISNDGLDDLNTAMHRAGHLQAPTKESLANTIGFASETQDGLMSKSQAKEVNKIILLEGLKDELDKLKKALSLDTLNSFKIISDPEYIFAIADQKGNIFFAIRWDASLYCPYFDFETLKTLLQYDADNEGRLARTVDAVGHVIEAIEKDGTKYIAKLRADSVDINRLKISNDGLDDLNTAMHRAGHLQTPTKESLGNTIGFASETQDGLMSKSQAKEVNKIILLEGLKDELDKLKKALSLDTLNSFKIISDPEYIFAIADQKENIFFAIRWDASLYCPYFDFERFINTLQHIDDAEGRLAITLDATGQILEATEKDGTKYIPRLKTDKLEFSGKKGLKSLGDALKSFGYFGKSDHSDKKLIQLPVPTHLAFMNLEVPKLPTTRDNNYKCPLEYWDMYGNYFKKDVIINAQGDSTLAYILKNIGLETVDGSKIQFDNWIAADSYHLKAHYTDAFRGESTLCYRYMKDITNTRPIGLRHPFDYQKRSNGFANGTGDITTDMASGANYIADGFPVALYHNGEFVSIMNMTLKKHRDNFEMDRNDPSHIWLDGTINTSTLWGEKINWPALEIRNPKPKKWDLVDIHGNKYITYDSLELSSDGNSGKVKKNLQAFSKAFADIRTNKDKAIFDNTFFADNLHDYMIFSNVLYHFDGFSKNWQWYTKDGKRWAISVHDCDLMLGKFWRANIIMADEVQATILGNEEIHPTYWAKHFYEEEFKQRYKELRDSGIVSSEYFVNKLSAWLGSITAPMLKMDLKKWNFPSYRASGTDEKNWQCVHMDRLWEAKEWDKTKEYKKGERVYVQTSEAKYVFRAVKDNQNKPPILKQVSEYTPLYLGFYESVDRVRQFLDMRIALLDKTWEYKK